MAHRDLGGMHVLVVEDTDDSREMLRMALEYCAALVTTASAEEAKRILDSIRPHLVVAVCGDAPSARSARRLLCESRVPGPLQRQAPIGTGQRHGDKLSRGATAPLRLPFVPRMG